MYLTTISNIPKNRIKTYKYEILKELTRNSKNIYNKSLYTIRQHFFKNNEYLNYPKVYHIIKNSFNQEGEIEYQKLPTNASQQTLKTVDNNFKSFFKLLKMKQKGKYDKKVKIPKYLPKNGHFKVIFTKIHFKIFDNKVRITLPQYLKKSLKNNGEDGFLWFKIPKNLLGKNINEIHIIPDNYGKNFQLAYLYKVEIKEKKRFNQNYLSIDLGINNLVSMINSQNGESILIDGKNIKSINIFFNKKKSILQSILKKSHNKFSSNKLDRMNQKRNNVLKDKFHKISKYIIQYCKYWKKK